jgi:hypothetical protein
MVLALMMIRPVMVLPRMMIRPVMVLPRMMIRPVMVLARMMIRPVMVLARMMIRPVMVFSLMMIRPVMVLALMMLVLVMTMFHFPMIGFAINDNAEPTGRIMLVQRFKRLGVGRAKLAGLAILGLSRAELKCLGLVIDHEIQGDRFRLDR